jgi:F0F1-type ATP synthase epsilon subunit
MNNQLTIKVQTPRDVLYEGPALAISSKNSQGPFDILPQHANFISLIDKQPITLIKLDRTKQVFNFTQAIIYSTKNKVTIFGDPHINT